MSRPSTFRDMFIGPPFRTCPKCGRDDAFGVFLSVTPHTFIRRCTLCSHEERFELPRLDKKICYLDQLALSHMLRAEEGAEFDGAAFWKRALDGLRTLVRAQLRVCPRSNFHYEESVVAPHLFEGLQHVYERLSGGVIFKDYEVIRRFQLHEHAKKWAGGRGDSPPVIERDEVLDGDLSAWQPRLDIAIRFDISEEEVTGLRDMREQFAEGLTDVFKDWQQSSADFDELWKQEGLAYGRTTLALALREGERLKAGSLFEVTAPLVAMTYVRKGLESGGVPDRELGEKTVEYLLSQDLLVIQFINIQSLLYAGLARRAQGGQKKLPSRGMTTDIRAISTLAPYCDALFLDRECHSLLDEDPIRGRIGPTGHFFSRRNPDEFLAWLEDLRASAGKGHFELVDELYGL